MSCAPTGTPTAAGLAKLLTAEYEIHTVSESSMSMRDLFANRISAFFGMDVVVSAIVLISFIQTEGKRLAMRFLWLPMLSVFLVGVSLGLPLFLYLRQLQLDSSRSLS